MGLRHIRLDGNLNLRDLGGYEVEAGSIVRWGCLFRSDELHALSDGDLETVATLGIKVVFDLRHHHERMRRPGRLPPDVELLERVSTSTGGESRTLEEQLAAGDLPVPDDEQFSGVYLHLLDQLRPDLKVIVERAVDAAQRPLLFHCAAGKDRTGIAAAILLGLLGVSDETILDDYELTSLHYSPGRLQTLAALMAEHDIAEERVLPLLQARRPVLAATLHHVHQTWGGYDTFAIEHLGVEAHLPQALRAALLTPSPA